MQVGGELRGQNNAIPPVLAGREVVPQNPLGVGVGVEVRGVDEVPAELQIGIQDLFGFGTLQPIPASSPNDMAPRQNGLTFSAAAQADIRIKWHHTLPSPISDVLSRPWDARRE